MYIRACISSHLDLPLDEFLHFLPRNGRRHHRNLKIPRRGTVSGYSEVNNTLYNDPGVATHWKIRRRFVIISAVWCGASAKAKLTTVVEYPSVEHCITSLEPRRCETRLENLRTIAVWFGFNVHTFGWIRSEIEAELLLGSVGGEGLVSCLHELWFEFSFEYTKCCIPTSTRLPKIEVNWKKYCVAPIQVLGVKIKTKTVFFRANKIRILFYPLGNFIFPQKVV